MTKLEEKLQELGYEQSKVIKEFYNKWFKYTFITIYINPNSTIKYEWCGVQRKGLRKFQQKEQIKELYKAFDEMQKDLEILKECEE